LIIEMAERHRIGSRLARYRKVYKIVAIDLFNTLNELQAWQISRVAQTGLQFDLGTPQGKLIASLMAALSEFERDLRERVRSGIAAAQARGVKFGRRPGQRVKTDRYQARVLDLVATGHSYRDIGLRLGMSKNTVLAIVKRALIIVPATPATPLAASGRAAGAVGVVGVPAVGAAACAGAPPRTARRGHGQRSARRRSCRRRDGCGSCSDAQ
jgi:DNA-binding CsgD family transcriptional regulator